jgi:glutathione synthase/RimK-type ligase-like ATP-grasp enzyme
MKRILVVGGHSAHQADMDELGQFCDGLNVAYPAAAVDKLPVDQLQFVVAPGNFLALHGPAGHSVSDYDLVILRNKMRTYNNVAYVLSRYCHAQGLRFFNDYSAYYPGTKAAQAVTFYEQGLPFLKTLFAMDPSVLRDLAQKELAFPFVLKDASGAKGESNYLIHNIKEMESRLAAEPDTNFIAQEYCPNDRDYRILIFGDEHLVFERRGGPGNHLNNTSRGAQAALAPSAVPSEIIAKAYKLARQSGLSVAGIDVMPKLGTTDFYFIETNSQPQLFTGALLNEKRQYAARMLQKFLEGS